MDQKSQNFLSFFNEYNIYSKTEAVLFYKLSKIKGEGSIDLILSKIKNSNKLTNSESLAISVYLCFLKEGLYNSLDDNGYNSYIKNVLPILDQIYINWHNWIAKNQDDKFISKILIYRGTIFRIHHGKDEVYETIYSSFTSDIVGLMENELSSNSTLIVSSTNFYPDEKNFTIAIDKFISYLKKKKIWNKNISYDHIEEHEVLYRIRYNEIIISDVVYNGIDE